MTPSLRVVTPGLMTTVQDLGRPGFQRLGVPVSGALDPVSLRAANLLVGNAPDAGALEVACLGPTIAVEADDVRIAVAGAHAAIEILPDAVATSASASPSSRTSAGDRPGSSDQSRSASRRGSVTPAEDSASVASARSDRRESAPSDRILLLPARHSERVH